ncbi:MAG: hypothetical protein K6T31_07910, partial [Alicyclobacillus sp.]|nr:hypothetical protein [Alicyclobacillus sp.]
LEQSLADGVAQAFACSTPRVTVQGQPEQPATLRVQVDLPVTVAGQAGIVATWVASQLGIAVHQVNVRVDGKEG